MIPNKDRWRRGKGITSPVHLSYWGSLLWLALFGLTFWPLGPREAPAKRWAFQTIPASQRILVWKHIYFPFLFLFPYHPIPALKRAGMEGKERGKGGKEGDHGSNIKKVKAQRPTAWIHDPTVSPIPFIREPVGHILGSLKQSCPTGSRIKEIGGRDLKESHDLAGYNQLLERKPGHDFNTSSRHTLTSGKLTNDRQVFSSFNHTCRSYG